MFRNTAGFRVRAWTECGVKGFPDRWQMEAKNKSPKSLAH